MHLRDDVIEGGTAAERIVAVGAPIPPAKVDLITRGSPGDQAGLINVVLIHRDPPVKGRR